MSILEKRIQKFYKNPIPNDITFDDVKVLADFYGYIVIGGGNHSKKVVHMTSGTVIPIPMHGKTLKEVYVKKLRKLFDSILEDRKR